MTCLSLPFGGRNVGQCPATIQVYWIIRLLLSVVLMLVRI